MMFCLFFLIECRTKQENNDYNTWKIDADSELVLEEEKRKTKTKLLKNWSIYFVVLVYLCFPRMIVDPMMMTTMNYPMKMMNLHDQIASRKKHISEMRRIS